MRQIYADGFDFVASRQKISPAITNRKLSELNVPCANPHCVTHFERGVKSLFYSDVKTFRCAYCDSQLKGDR